MASVFKAEIQARPAGSRSSRRRAVVSMPRSPTSAMDSSRSAAGPSSLAPRPCSDPPSGEALLDPRLPPQQPVEHVEHFVAADGTEAEQGTEAAGGGLRGQAASGGELGAGLEYAGDYGGEVTPAAAAALQEALEAKLTADAVDDLGGQFGEVGEGGAADALAVALGLAEEDGGGLLRLGMTSTW